MVWDSYFWVHELFALVHELDASFRAQWDETLHMPAAHRFHFGPNSAELLAPPPAGMEDLLRAPPIPVFKLTHKFEFVPGAGTLFVRLCAFGESDESCGILTTSVCW